MKRQLVALFALTACATAVQAQSSVTLYGDIDQYVGYIRSSSGNSILGLNDGTSLRSRWGLRGAEDLGAGLKAKFTLEQGFAADSGSFADSSRMFDRQAWVGLETPAGEFRFGRQNTITFFVGGAVDWTERTTFGSVINTFGVPSRYDNDISYKTPRMAGFQAEVHAALGEQANHLGRQNIYQAGVDYTNGPFRVGYNILDAKFPGNTATVTKDILYHNAYANYDYGMGKVYLAFVRSNNSTSSAAGNNAGTVLSNISNPNNFFAGTNTDANRYYNVYQISADYKVTPAVRVGALVGYMKDSTAAKNDVIGGNIGAYYDMSKRTQLYGMANYMKNKNAAGFRFSGSAGPSANLTGADVNGQSMTGLQVGMIHKF